MTQRIKGFTVLLKEDMRDDDSAEIGNALLMVKGVQSVVPLEATSDDWLARERVRQELIEKLWNVLKP